MPPQIDKHNPENLESPPTSTRIAKRCAPFSTPVFTSLNSDHDNNIPPNIPGHSIPLSHSTVTDFLSRELSTQRLSSIYRHLWMCGLRGNLHALHWQRMMSRTILITENPALHLVWDESTIFVKPLPRCLLDLPFWTGWICPDDDMWKEANGFMRSYTRLIQHESDHRIALELGLLPVEVTWTQWSILRAELLSSLPYPYPNSDHIVAQRYHYGELRLFRLNLAYRVFRAQPLGFFHPCRDYQTFFTRSFAWILLFFVYASTTLTAFQTVNATEKSHETLQRIGFWCAVLVLIAISAGIVIQILLFAFLFIFNLIWTLTRMNRQSKYH